MTDLPSTEAPDRETDDIDRVDRATRVRLLIDAHRRSVDAVAAVADDVAAAVGLVVEALRGGGKVVAVGAGTSGRLAVLDAAELAPTFGLPMRRYSGRIAGGDAALRRSIEGAEDDAFAGAAAVVDLVDGDLLIGVSASGRAPFVAAALTAVRARNVATIAVVNVADAPLARLADVTVAAITGAEPIAGSTRLRAGTAQKIVLNTISTAAMIELGKTYRNRMVDVVAMNAKLRGRAQRLVRELAGDVDAPALLAAAGDSVKTAVVMARRNVGRLEAEALLDEAGGRLAEVIPDEA
jgi:N-acetylmuramic acid 6-phosphate etherase